MLPVVGAMLPVVVVVLSEWGWRWKQTLCEPDLTQLCIYACWVEGRASQQLTNRPRRQAAT